MIRKALIPLLMGIAMAIGVLLGVNLSSGTSGSSASKWEKIDQILQYVEEDYVDTVSRRSLEDEVIAYLLQRLDPHSYYISEDDVAMVNEPLNGGFQGIGIQFNMSTDTVYVINTIKGGPSEKAGILPGDRIIKVEDSLIAGVGMDTRSVMSLLKGEAGTTVNVSVLRGGKELPFALERDEIELSSIDAAYLLNDSTIYVKLARFAKQTHEEFLDRVTPLKTKSVHHLVLDLRGNGGGYLEAAVRMADEFLEEGKLITYTEGKNRPRKEYVATSDGELEDVSLVVIIDGLSASASEIVAGAIQDQGRGVIVGRRSFGKGLVQEQNQWSDGSATRLTVARYYTPKGKSIQKPYDHFSAEDQLPGDTLQGGVEPDVTVERDTTGVTWLYAELIHRGLLTEFVYDYRDANFAQWKNLGFDQFDEQLMPEETLEALRSYLNARKFEINEKEWNRSQDRMATRCHALIARSLFGEEAYYKVMNRRDEAVQAAKKVIKKPRV